MSRIFGTPGATGGMTGAGMINPMDFWMYNSQNDGGTQLNTDKRKPATGASTSPPGLHYHCGRRVLSGRMRERLQDERRGFADHCRVDATGDRVHALPETTTRLAFAESRAADSPHAICDGSNRTQVPGDITCTSPHAKHRRYGPLRSRPRRSRPASALPSKFRRRRRRPGRGSDRPQRAAARAVRSASVR